MRQFLTAAVVLAIGLGLPSRAQSQTASPPRSKIRAVDLVTFVKSVNSYAAVTLKVLDGLDDLTETESETVRVGVSKVGPECASFVVTYRVPEIELSKSLTNSIWLLGDVPGRTVTTSICTDCLVSEWYDVPGKARAKSDPSTLLIRLAPKRLMTEFPEDARVHTDLGSFRFEFLGSSTAPITAPRILEQEKPPGPQFHPVDPGVKK
jgi:hypothetical protein